MAFLSDLLLYGGLIVQATAMLLLLRGPVSRYFPVFLFNLTSIAFAGMMLSVGGTGSANTNLYYNVFWGGEILLDLLLFFLVISLTARALEGHNARPMVMRVMSMILVVALALPFVAFKSAVFGRHWNQSVAQLFNFGAALMNLALWSALIISKQRDRQLLMVSAGLGIMVAGAALTLGVRQFTAQDDVLRVITDYVYRAGQVAGPLVWCWAFWPHKPSAKDPFKRPSFKAPTRAAG